MAWFGILWSQCGGCGVVYQVALHRSLMFNIKLDSGHILARCAYRALDTLVGAAAMVVAGCLNDKDKVTELPIPTTLYKEISRFL